MAPTGKGGSPGTTNRSSRSALAHQRLDRLLKPRSRLALERSRTRDEHDKVSRADMRVRRADGLPLSARERRC